MSEPFVGEIKAVAFNWAPMGWLPCNGQILSITQYQALFALIGNFYGGDGRTNFALPNLQGRVAAGLATNQSTCPPGVTFNRYSTIAGAGGAESGTSNSGSATLAAANLPGHTHPATFTPTGGGSAAQVNVTSTTGTLPSPVGNMLAQAPASGPTQALIYAPAGSAVAGQLAGVSGGGGGGGTVAVESNNPNPPASITLPPVTTPVLQPYLVMNYIIAWQGIFPSRP